MNDTACVSIYLIISNEEAVEVEYIVQMKADGDGTMEVSMATEIFN